MAIIIADKTGYKAAPHSRSLLPCHFAMETYTFTYITENTYSVVMSP